MRTTSMSAAALAVSLLLVCSCGGDSSKDGGAAASSRFALKADPAAKAGELSVAEARLAAPKGPVVVVGRVQKLLGGFAAFTLIDASMKYCGETGKEDGCEEPWDYCCYPTEEITSHLLPVAVKENGKEVEVPKLPELRNLDLVAVAGSLVRAPNGEVSFEATGWYRRERPTLPPGIKFPQ